MSAINRRVALLLIPLVLLALAAVATRADACPFCDGGPDGVNEVRDGVFDENFWPRVAATVAPFPVLAGVVALIYFGPPRVRLSRHEDTGVAEPTPPSSSA